MAFRFRLERVLSVRRLQEEAAQGVHAVALRCLRQIEECLTELTKRLSESMDDLDRLKVRDELTAEALHLHGLHLAGLRREILRATGERKGALAHVERTAAELLEAHQAREALERLRERQEALWRQEQAVRDARAFDELAVSRHRAREEESHGP
jgi:flagellar export protein FliJ